MALILKNLCKSFDEKAVLTNVSHRFEEGRITCILGVSGIGKTTLLRMLLGLTLPDSGQIIGMDQRCHAAVFQEDRLISHLSAIENIRIALPRGVSMHEITDALIAVGLSDAIDQPIRTLSGGMQRRVSIVRAVLSDSEIVIMDEPFRGLDEDTRAQVIQWMLPKLQGRTVLIVTHSSEEAALLHASIWHMEPVC